MPRKQRFKPSRKPKVVEIMPELSPFDQAGAIAPTIEVASSRESVLMEVEPDGRGCSPAAVFAPVVGAAVEPS